MRNKFITADMGVSGANIAVGETGTVFTVSNEGNARLTVLCLNPRICCRHREIRCEDDRYRWILKGTARKRYSTDDYQLCFHVYWRNGSCSGGSQVQRIQDFLISLLVAACIAGSWTLEHGPFTCLDTGCFCPVQAAAWKAFSGMVSYSAPPRSGKAAIKTDIMGSDKPG